MKINDNCSIFTNAKINKVKKRLKQNNNLQTYHFEIEIKFKCGHKLNLSFLIKNKIVKIGTSVQKLRAYMNKKTYIKMKFV